MTTERTNLMATEEVMMTAVYVEPKKEKVMDEDLKAYRNLVDIKAASDSSDVFPNAGENHAAVVMAKMFDKTEKHVNMVVGSFDGSVSDIEEYMTSLINCVNRDVSFHILFLNTPNQHSTAFKYLRQKKQQGKQIVFKTVSEAYKAKFTKKKNEQIHFSTFDENKLRLEKDTKKYLAWCCFNDTKSVGMLNEIFNKAFNDSKLLA